MASGRKRSTVELGHDAFLDIVANLVGILIILVAVLGSRSQAMVQQVIRDGQVTEQEAAELSRDVAQAAAAQADVARLENAIRRHDVELASRRRERGALVDLLTVARQAWDETQQTLSQQARQAAQQQAAVAAATRQLQQLRGEGERLEAVDAPLVTVEHLPTPMAKTVFGDELHFRLKAGRLSVVPVDQLLEQIRDDFARSARGGREGRAESAVGPVRGYVAQYEMDKEFTTVNRGGSMATATRIQLVGMTIQPLSEPHGQPMEKVLADSSELDVELAGRDPATTTITVWVYPDSFAGFRQLKEHLYRRGFATAARPLPADLPISGGPQGSRSNAQ